MYSEFVRWVVTRAAAAARGKGLKVQCAAVETVQGAIYNASVAVRLNGFTPCNGETASRANCDVRLFHRALVPNMKTGDRVYWKSGDQLVSGSECPDAAAGCVESIDLPSLLDTFDGAIDLLMLYITVMGRVVQPSCMLNL